MSYNETSATVKTPPRELFLHLFIFITSYVSFFSLGQVLFAFIYKAMQQPGPMAPFSDLMETIRYSIALLIVAFPAYCIAAYFAIRAERIDHLKKKIRTRQVLAVFTLFLTGLICLAAFACLVYYFLLGEATLPLFLKVLAVLVISVLVYYYYHWDIKRKWPTWQKVSFFTIASIFVISSIGYGFHLIGSPWKVKALKEDEFKEFVLNDIQTKIVRRWVEKERLPDALAELGITETFPVYKKTGRSSFQLCAMFNLPSTPEKASFISHINFITANGHSYTYLENWSSEHTAGFFCFSRAINPKLIKLIAIVQPQ
jgi:hypothetical protein